MAQAVDTSTVWRVDEPVRRLAVAVAVFFLVIAVALTASGIALPGALLGWVLAAAVMLCMWRWYLVPYVALTADSLRVQGVFSLRSVRYGAIRDVRPGPMGLRVVTTQAGSFRAWAVQAPKRAEPDRRAQLVVAAIMERVERASVPV